MLRKITRRGQKFERQLVWELQFTDEGDLRNPAVDLSRNLAAQVARELRQSGVTSAQLRDELLALARLSPAEATDWAARALAEGCVRLGHRAEASDLIHSYLSHVPGVLARRLRLVGPGRVEPRAQLLRSLLPRRAPLRPVGSLLPGSDLEVTGYLGGGGAGEVYAARYRVAEAEPVAVKVPRGDYGARLVRIEATVLRKLHARAPLPGVPGFRALNTTGGLTPWLETTYVEGYSLDELQNHWHGAAAAFTPRWLRGFLADVARILERIHDRGFVHRDLKPANLLVARRGSRLGAAWVIDLGIAGLDDTLPRREEWLMGDITAGLHAHLQQYAMTPPYASRQQQANKLCRASDDIHALGVLAVRLLSGDPGADPRDTPWRVQAAGRGPPRWLTDLVGACVHDDRNRRPANGGELLRCLEQQRATW